jgi:hypothetical protein
LKLEDSLLVHNCLHRQNSDSKYSIFDRSDGNDAAFTNVFYKIQTNYQQQFSKTKVMYI